MADLFYLVTNWAPFYTALTCVILLLLINASGKNGIYVLLILFLTTIITNWLVMNTFYYLSSDAIILMPLLFLGLLNPVLLYHFIFLLTRLDKEEEFTRKHYLFAAIAYLAILCIFGRSFFIYGKELTFMSTVDLMPPIRAIFSLFYTVLVIKRIRMYRKEVLHIFSDQQKASLVWLSPILGIYIIQIALPLIALISGIDDDGGNYTNPFLFLIVLFVSFQNISLTYNVIAGNFETISPKSSQENNRLLSEEAIIEIEIPKNNTNDAMKEKLENYFGQEKPYLQSDLRIMDLIIPLQTNRTYLSTFINQTYNMNFCGFINHFRIVEYEKFRSDPKNHSISNNELAIEAGFTNYKAYLRAKQKEAEETRVIASLDD